jgi:hypothetical protein
MPKAKGKTHFEQVPLEEIAKLIDDQVPPRKRKARFSSVVRATSAKTQPYSVRTLVDDSRS